MLLFFLIAILSAVILIVVLLVDCVLELLLVLHLEHLLVGDEVLLLLLLASIVSFNLLSEWLGALGPLAELLQVFVQAIGKQDFLATSRIVGEGILLSQLLDSSGVAISVRTHHLLSELLSLKLPLLFLLFKFSFFPLFVGYSSHDLLVGGSLLFLVFNLPLFLIAESLFDVLVSLFEETLLEPILEDFIGCFLLDLLLEPLILSLPVGFNALLLIFLPLSLLPLRHPHLLLLLADLLFSLMPSDLLQDVSLGLLDELFLELDLMLFLAHPFLMSHSVGRAVANLASLHCGLVAWSA